MVGYCNSIENFFHLSFLYKISKNWERDEKFFQGICKVLCSTEPAFLWYCLDFNDITMELFR